MKKVAIVGGGSSSLFCGALLTKKGFSIEIYEKAREVGGRARCIEKNGFIIDYGIHFIKHGEKGIICSTFKEIGENLDVISLKEPELFYYENKNFYECPTGKKFLQSNFVDDRDKNIVFKAFTQPDFVEKNMDKSILSWLEEEGASDVLKKFLKLVALGIICPFIEKASAGEAIELVRTKSKLGNPPTAYPVGGFRTIHKNLTEFILNAGGKIHTSKEVKNISIENEQVKEIYVDNEKIKPDIVICAVPPKDIFNVIDEKLIKPEKVNFLKNITPTYGISIDYCLKEKVTDFDKLIICVEDLNIFGAVTSNIDGSIAPKTKQLMTFVAITAKDEILNKTKNIETQNKFERKIEEMFPKISKYIEFKRIINHQIIDGVELNIQQNRKKRPKPTFLEIEGLFLTGDYLCGESSGGDLAITSAHLCANEIASVYK